MRKLFYTLSAIAAALAAAGAGAQLGPPPPGSVHGTESGTYGSSVGFDVRGTGPVDRFGRPNDLMNPTDTGLQKVDPRDPRKKADEDDRGLQGARGPADARSSVPGANMNPGLGAGAPGTASQRGMSPNLNPGLSSGAAPSGAGAAGGSTAGPGGASGR